MEPPDPHLPGGQAADPRLPGLIAPTRPTSPTGAAWPTGPVWPTAFSAGAAVLVLTTTGDGLLAAVLLGVAAADAWAGGVAVLAVLGGLARFGTTSLAGVAGAQAVLGPAVFVGSSLGAVGSALAALACVAVAPRDWRGLPFGLLAGVVALGPAATGWGDGLVRALGALVGMGLVVCARRLPRPTVTPMAALAAAGVGLLLAVIG